MQKIISIAIAVAMALTVSAQNRAVIDSYEECPDPKPGSKAAWQTVEQGVTLGFAGKDTRYPKGEAYLSGLEREWRAAAWRGERIHTQIVLRTTVALESVAVDAGQLKSRDGSVIPASAASVGTVRYVLTDGLNDEGFGCGVSPERQADASLSADAIDPVMPVRIEANTVRPFWLSIQVPHDTPPGLYRGTVRVKTGKHNFKLPYTVEVKDRLLPPPAEWGFHLDLWQNPYSVARYYDVPVWSERHFALMKPYMEMLAAAGQKSVTVSMIHDPWRGQTYDIYQSMIRWIKHADGTWSYDYTIFDKWVGFMESLGIDKLVNCYTMVPWNNKFYYHDEGLGRDTVLVAKTGTPEFNEHWIPMLRDFARHLRSKGWFGRTAIAMDERPFGDMLAVIRLVKDIDPDFKISLAGSYHAEITDDIYDYCIASAESYPADVLERRVAGDLPTTFYTYCMEGRPNTFTFSPPAEAAWMGWYAAAKGYSGYLRWAYNCWPQDPLRDSRYSTWSGGDTYLVYPGPRSSIRFERLVEGIQDYEKVRILMDEFTREGRKEEAKSLRAVLDSFETSALERTSAAEMVGRAQKTIGKY